MTKESAHRRSTPEDWAALKITAIYLLIGGAWVLFSNRVLSLLISDPSALTRLQTFKGWIYVLATAWMLHMLIYRNMLALRGSQEALQERKARLRAMVDAFDGHICVTAPDHRIEFMNDRLIERNGGDATGGFCYKAMHGLDEPCPWCPCGEVFGGGETVRTEIQSPKDSHWYYVVHAPMQHPDGTVSCISTYLDITERKHAEEALWASELRYRATIDSLDEIIHVVDPDLRMVLANTALLKIVEELGLETDVLGRTVKDVFPFLPDTVFEEYCRVFETGEPVITEEQLDIKGREFITETRKIPIFEGDDVVRVITVVRDVTARKRAEAALMESEELLTDVVESIQDGISVLDAELTIVRVNEAMKKWYAHMVPLEGKKCYEAYHGRSEPCEVCPSLRALQSSKLEMNEVALMQDGCETGVLELFAFPILDSAGQPAGVVEYVRDITHSKRASAERERLAGAVEQAAEAVVMADVEGDITYVNSAFEKITGFTRDEVIGRNIRLLKSGKHENSFYEQIEKAANRGKVWSGRLTSHKKDGSAYESVVTISPLRGAGNKIMSYVGIMRDVTHEVELERQFMQAQKMESIGRLAGGIAHDFNNLLTTIINMGELVREQLDDGHQAREDVEEIVHAGKSAAELTKQLLALSRRQQAQLRPVNLDKIILKIDPLLRRSLGAHIEFETVTNGEDLCIEADAGQIEQVIMNLAVNARDAMPEGGSLTIKSDKALLDDEDCRARLGIEPGKYAVLAVRDTGCGMSETIQERAFEPFFTTKEEGKGTGLGLSTVYGIVRQHRGCIELHSDPETGTEFKIYFPCVGESSESADA